MDCKTCKALRAEMNCEPAKATISAHLHEAIMARQERTIRRFYIITAFSLALNIITIGAVLIHG